VGRRFARSLPWRNRCGLSDCFASGAGAAKIIIPRWQDWARAAKKRLDDILAADPQKLAA
jgi:hypothetical protein